MSAKEWQSYNPTGSKRVLVTKTLPGKRWLEVLTTADCRVEVCTSPEILSVDEIKAAIGNQILSDHWRQPACEKREQRQVAEGLT